jgi:hypothetical protein
MGTDTGNPARSDSMPTSDGEPGIEPTNLGNWYSGICVVLKSCHANLQVNDCSAEIKILPGLAYELGASDPNATIEAVGAPISGPTVSACINELAALSCSDPAVQAAYDPNAASPYAGVLALVVPMGACSKVYVGR